MAPRPAARLAPARGQGVLVALLRAAGMTDEELVDEREPLGRLELVAASRSDSGRPPTRSRSRPRTTGSARTADDRRPARRDRRRRPSTSVDDVARTITIKRGADRSRGVALPRSIVPQGVVPSRELAESLLRTGRLGRRARARRCDGAGTVPAAVAGPAPAARRRTPARARAAPLRRAGRDGARRRRRRLVRAMAGGACRSRGRPGSGKTYTGAQMIVALVGDGKRVGVIANSHKVIGNVLDEVAKAAPGARRQPVAHRPEAEGRRRRPTHARRDRRSPTTRRSRRRCDGDGRRRRRRGLDVVPAGVRAAGARLDVLFVDEAGQFSLANALACAPAARSLVLLGDPQQLDQPTQGSHPPGRRAQRARAPARDPAYRADRATIRADEGLFLDDDVAPPPGHLRLHLGGVLRRPAPAARRASSARRCIAPRSRGPADGHRARATCRCPHAGNDTDSVEEATAIAELVADAARGAARRGPTATGARRRSRSTTS